jgi:putative serine protease PepD
MKQPLNTPWWQPAAEKQPRIYVQKRNNSSIIVLVVVVSLIAGAIGATIGRNTTDNLGANLVQTENVVERAPGSIAALAARLIPAVVSITVNGSGGSGTGSGFFLDSDGYILTNNHVVESAANSGRIIVETSDGKKYPAKLIDKCRAKENKEETHQYCTNNTPE